jgi:hypothetical protein
MLYFFVRPYFSHAIADKRLNINDDMPNELAKKLEKVYKSEGKSEKHRKGRVGSYKKNFHNFL